MKNFLTEMLYLLTSAYTRKDHDNQQMLLPLETNIGKLFAILAWGLDSAQEQAQLVKLWDNLDNAKGSVLDRYGANFGVKRVSPDDRFYRLAIKVKLIAQISGGDSDTVIRAAGDLLDVELSDVLLEDVYPAKIALYVDQDLLSQDRLELIEPIAYAIKRILAAGVGMRLYLRTYRTYRSDVTVLWCGYGDSYIAVDPVGQDRESVNTLGVNYGGFAGAAFAPPPFSKDRTGIEVWGVSHGGYANSNFAPPPFSRDRMARTAVQTAHGALQTPEVVIHPPDAKAAHTARQDGAGGAIYHAHIKSKRID